MAWAEVDAWGWVNILAFILVYHHAVLAVAVAAHHFVRPLSLLAERGAYLALCCACTTVLVEQVKDLTGIASAGPFPNFMANCCSVLVKP